MDRAVDHPLPGDRRVLAAGGLDADAHARARREGGGRGATAAAGLSQAVLDLVRLRVPSLRIGGGDLLADDRAAGAISARLAPRGKPGRAPVRRAALRRSDRARSTSACCAWR